MTNQDKADAADLERAMAVGRAADRQYRAEINREVLIDLLKAMGAVPEMVLEDGMDLGTPLAKAIVTALAKGEVRHCRLEY